MKRIITISMALAVAGVGSSASAAVMEYQISSSSSQYGVTRNAAQPPPVSDVQVDVGGTIKVDTATGVLVSAQFTLGSYSENYYYAAPWTFSDYAVVDHDSETQTVGAGVTGTFLNATTLRFSSANVWSTTAGGSVSCEDSAGAQGNSTCAAAALSAWSPFAIDLLFQPDFSALMVNSFNWTDNVGGTTNINSLSLLAYRVPSAVPVPAAMWLMGSGLVGLVAMRRRS